MTGDDVRLLLDALAREAGEHGELVETHISWVLLVGDEVLKFKKPVDFGFVDFSTLERRRHFCHEEVRLNRRLAPHLYLGVVAIGGTPDEPTIDGREPLSADAPDVASGAAWEYAVRMRRFGQDDLLANVLDRGALTAEHVDEFARGLAAFHAAADRAPADGDFGTPDHVWQPVAQNFATLSAELEDADHRERLGRLLDWSSAEHERLRASLVERLRGGFVRECHGDAHLGNAILERSADGDHVVLFDGIEFAPELRWIDVVSDAAFAAMDLADRGRIDLARRFLSTYFEWTGDDTGLPLVRFHVVYRALVRAKVARLRRAQTNDASERSEIEAELEGYLRLAETSTEKRSPFVLLVCGFSGSGKSTLGQRVVETAGAIRVRSDVERKRLAGLEPHETGPADVLYSSRATAETYARLREMAERVVEAGFPVVVDATFLDRSRRRVFRELAGELGVPFVIAHATAPADVLRERIVMRARDGGDASDADVAVLERQFASAELPDAAEADILVEVDTCDPASIAQLSEVVAELRSTSRETETDG